ncbi:MAG: hypothetical protein M3498_09660, partial [Deinococcota bacterium]|nr:hypothetical protein [Deinococcota bacterium]
RGPAEGTMRVLYLYGSIPPALHDMKLSDTGRVGMSRFAAALEEVGFQPEERLDANVTLNADTLRAYRVVILGSNNRRFNGAEAGALAEWVLAGGGVVAWSDSAFGGDYREVGVGNPVGKTSNNDLTVQFGLEFLRDNGAGIFTIREYLEDHYLNAYDRNGGVVFRGEGVSLIRASSPARILARLQTGGTRGDVRLHPDDGALTAADGALVVAEVGEGRVVGTFDRNGFWNGGPGTDISEVDNKEHAQRLLLWAAGLGD